MENLKNCKDCGSEKCAFANEDLCRDDVHHCWIPKKEPNKQYIINEIKKSWTDEHLNQYIDNLMNDAKKQAKIERTQEITKMIDEMLEDRDLRSPRNLEALKSKLTEKKEYVLKFINPQVTIQEDSKEGFKNMMGWDEAQFMDNVFVRLKAEKEPWQTMQIKSMREELEAIRENKVKKVKEYATEIEQLAKKLEANVPKDELTENINKLNELIEWANSLKNKSVKESITKLLEEENGIQDKNNQN
jgi:hypothetical protein